jgi:AcrR family transcriptional regulator
MTQAARRDRNRVDTDRSIRTVARTLLVSRGRQGVTLRAIAREMGITAPALYRYYDSFEDLIRHVCTDICADLTAELAAGLAAVPDEDPPGQVFAVCRGFRAWAVRHPQEFSLVFATPASGQPTDCTPDPFGRIFLTVAARVLTGRHLAVPPDHEVPENLHADLAEFRATLINTLAETGIELPEHLFPLGAAYTMVRFWVRLYGQVALEVFGRLPFSVSVPEVMFESMVAELATEIGLTAKRP